MLFVMSTIASFTRQLDLKNARARLIILTLLAAIGIVAASWGFSSLRAPVRNSDVVEEYFASARYRASSSTDELAEQLQQGLKAAPQDWRAYSLLGVVYLQRARETGDPSYYSKAEGVLQRALELEPSDYTAISAQGALALARHQFSSAMEWGQSAIELNPNKTYAYGVVADAQVELGQYEQAAQTLQTMVDLRPDLSSYARISYLRELYGDTEGALDMMQRAVGSGGTNLENRAWTITQLANLYFNVGRLDQAELEYRRALEILPGYMYGLAGLGRVRAAQGRIDEAISLYEKATAVIPLPEFVIALGDLYDRAGKPEQAQKQYDLVRTIQQLYQANGVNLDMELALFNADHDVNPAATVTQARAAFVRHPSIHGADVLAWALYKAGDYQKAEGYAQQALHLGTKDALKLFHAGMIAYRLGQRDRARDYLTQALTINPHFSILYADQAQSTLEELR